jgi:anti-sigma regulatory factor (Ser/Thr protein kinase)
MDRSFGESRTDSATVDTLASMLWSAARGATRPSQFADLCDREQTKLRMAVREAMTWIVDAARRHLDECPSEPVSFEAIASAAEMEVTTADGNRAN